MTSARILGAAFAMIISTSAFACSSSEEGAGGGGSPGGDDFGFSSAPPVKDDGEDPTCAASVAAVGKPKADIIFVIDNSGSMSEEIAQIRANVNKFAAKVDQGGFDAHVIFIVAKAGGTYPSSLSLCVPTPLAKAGCADNPPKFFHVNQDVQSTNSLDLILATYDGSLPSDPFFNGGAKVPPWKDKLRLDATKVFVEVSDDESFMKAEDFDTALLAKQPAGMFGNKQHRNYIFHSIVSKPAAAKAPSSLRCPTAAGPSLEYQKLSLLTGGIIDEVCKTDYSSVLDNLAKGIAERLACELGVPSAASADPTKLAVSFSATGQAPTKFTQVTDASKCASVKDGWYYDDPARPTKIILCPGTCGTVKTTVGAKVEALVGCKAPAPR